MTKYMIAFLVFILAVLPMTGSALVVSRSSTDSILNNDNHGDEDASHGRANTGTAVEVTTVGNSTGNTGARFYGQAEAKVGQSITQTINATVTWTATAESWEEYSINFTPEFHAYLDVEDNGADASGDGITFSAFTAILSVNGSTVGDSLDLSGGSRITAGSSNLDRTDFQTLSSYSGNNVFSLQYTATVTADAAGGLNYTGDVGLWGADGTLGGEIGIPADWDEYSSTSATSSADGLFVDANVTLDAVPEPATAGFMAFVGALGFLVRRHFMS